VINLHGVSKPTHVAAEHINSRRFCAYQISAATTAQDAAINHYWTPLARSAIKMVDQGKMAVTVPKQHLTRSQRRALRLAEWADQTFAPKPKLVCVQITPGGTPASSGATTVSSK
jgi:hypothetical protein